MKKINIYTEDRLIKLLNEDKKEINCYVMFTLNEFGEQYIAVTDGNYLIWIGIVRDDKIDFITDEKELEVFNPYITEFLETNEVKTLDGKKMLYDNIIDAYHKKFGDDEEDIN